MYLVYIDDSRDEAVCVFSALLIPAERWRECFELLRSFRRQLKQTDGIFVRKELHAWKLVSGRGRISDRVVTKYRRSQIFKEALQLATQLPEIRIANACSTANDDERAFEYLANRINRTMKAWSSHAILICDEGKEAAYTRLLRRMGVFNPIPSMLGGWPEGTTTRNIPTEYILEDPVFKVSGGWSASSSRTPRTRSVRSAVSGILSPCRQLSVEHRYLGGSKGDPSVRWSLNWYIRPPFPGRRLGRTAKQAYRVERRAGPPNRPLFAL